jgi:hypothetical protein
MSKQQRMRTRCRLGAFLPIVQIEEFAIKHQGAELDYPYAKLTHLPKVHVSARGRHDHERALRFFDELHTIRRLPVSCPAELSLLPTNDTECLLEIPVGNLRFEIVRNSGNAQHVTRKANFVEGCD